MVQKYAIKGLVKDCISWSGLRVLLGECRTKKLITKKSALKLEGELFHADRDNVGEFYLLKEHLLAALNGKALR